MIVAEALDALWSLGWAVLAWLLIFATVGTLALEALAVGLYAALRGLWRLARPQRRPRPSWTRTRRASRAYVRTLPDYDEAA